MLQDFTHLLSHVLTPGFILERLTSLSLGMIGMMDVSCGFMKSLGGHG